MFDKDLQSIEFNQIDYKSSNIYTSKIEEYYYLKLYRESFINLERIIYVFDNKIKIYASIDLQFIILILIIKQYNKEKRAKESIENIKQKNSYIC